MSRVNYLQLKALGQTGDTFNDVIGNLLAEHFEGKKMVAHRGTLGRITPMSLCEVKSDQGVGPTGATGATGGVNLDR